ncbi:hypothetical protein ACOME3_002556 [Neoechinorhynchus agilis]
MSFVVIPARYSIRRAKAQMDIRAILEEKRREHNLKLVDTPKNWQLFYKRNGTRFFKSRYWILREIPELITSFDLGDGPFHYLDVGCGVGDLILPLLEELQHSLKTKRPIVGHGCDFAQEAIRLARERSNDVVDFWVCDLTNVEGNPLRDRFKHEKVDAASMVFVLSAIRPNKFARVINNVSEVMKQGGFLFIRDYASQDHAINQFGPEQKVCDRGFVRCDGTRTYFFEPREIIELFCEHFEPVDVKVVTRKTENRKEQKSLDRFFVQGKFLKK